MQILCKFTPSEVIERIRTNTVRGIPRWWQNEARNPPFPVASKIVGYHIELRKINRYPSFFTPLLRGKVSEEDNGSRLSLARGTNISSIVLLGCFICVFLCTLILPEIMPSAHTFRYLSLGGIAMMYIGRITSRSIERELKEYVSQLFDDSHVWD